MYLCAFELVKDGERVLAWPFWPGRADCTEGYDFDDAVSMAADWLHTLVLHYLAQGKEVPKSKLEQVPARGGQIIIVAVDASLRDVPAVTAAEAASRLGISTARVAQLCKSGELESWREGATRMVSEESIEYRIASAPHAGRPRKKTAASL